MALKNQSFQRLFSVLKYDIKEHFFKYKWLYLFLVLACVFGLIIGFVATSKHIEDVALSDLPDTTLLGFINKTITPASLFFSRFFSFLGLFLLVWACGSVVYFCFIPVVLIIYRAVLLAVNCSILIHLYKLGGIIDVVIIFFPVHFILLFCLLIWAVVCLKQSFECKKTGISIFSLNFLLQHKNCICCCLILSFIVMLLECLLLPCVSTVVFIGVS